MLGFGRKKNAPIEEHEADGEVERIYHQIRHTMRATGVSAMFRAWAAHERSFTLLWSALRPNLETRDFEESADALRTGAVGAASKLDRVRVFESVEIGHSQRHQLSSALDLYRYLDPKLLLTASSVRIALTGGALGDPTAVVERIELGAPAEMPAMELVADDPSDRNLKTIFDDIRATLDVSAVPCDFRGLALWPDYLAAAWRELKPLIQSSELRIAADHVREQSRAFAARLPFGIAVTPAAIEQAGEDPAELIESTTRFETVLSVLILAGAILGLDRYDRVELERSPYPARRRARS